MNAGSNQAFDLEFWWEFPGTAVLAVSVRGVGGKSGPHHLLPWPQSWPRPHQPPVNRHQGPGLCGARPPVQRCGGAGGGRHPQEAGQRGEGLQLCHVQHVHRIDQCFAIPWQVPNHSIYSASHGTSVSRDLSLWEKEFETPTFWASFSQLQSREDLRFGFLRFRTIII